MAEPCFAWTAGAQSCLNRNAESAAQAAAPHPNACSRERTLPDRGVGEALAHVLAPVRAREVHAVALGGRDEPADLLDPVLVEPALPPPALHGKAVGRLLVGSAELVPALVREDPELDRRRHLVDELRIEDQEARIG